MKLINNSTEFAVILSKEEIDNLMACCNAAGIRWGELEVQRSDKTWGHMQEMANQTWLKLYQIKNPNKEV